MICSISYQTPLPLPFLLSAKVKRKKNFFRARFDEHAKKTPDEL